MWHERLAEIYRVARFMVASEPGTALSVLLVALGALVLLKSKQRMELEVDTPKRNSTADRSLGHKLRVITLYGCVFVAIVLTPLIWLVAAVLTDSNIRDIVLYAVFPGVLVASFGLVYLYRPLKTIIPTMNCRTYACIVAALILLASSQPYTFAFPQISVETHKEPREVQVLMDVIDKINGLEANDKSAASEDEKLSIMLPKDVADRVASYERKFKLYTEEEHIPTTFYVADADKVSYYVEPARNYGCSLIVVPIAQDNEGYLIDLYKLKRLGATEEYVIYGADP